MTSTSQVIEVRGIRKRFKDIQAVDKIDLDVFEKDIYGFLGPNGSGKSTTIRIMLSLIKPDAGSVRLLGKALDKSRHEVLSNVGALIERPNLYENFSAYKNLDLLSKYMGAKVSPTRIMEVLELLGLKERAHSKVKTYSKGMKQRLGIAQALVHDPKLLILDEPSSGLDPNGMKDIRELILYLNKELGKTILLSSHQLHEIEAVANRMIIINSGKVVVEGFVNQLLNQGDVIVKFSVDDVEKAMKILGESRFEIKEMHAEKNVICLNCSKDDTGLMNQMLIEQGIIVEALNKTRTLEELFLNLT